MVIVLHQQAEHGIRPGKPWPGETPGIIRVKSFMHMPGPVVGVFQCLQSCSFFRLIRRGKSMFNQPYMPDISISCLRSSDSRRIVSLLIPCILLTTKQLSNLLIQMIIFFKQSIPGIAKKAGEIRVIHQIKVSQTVRFIRIYAFS